MCTFFGFLEYRIPFGYLVVLCAKHPPVSSLPIWAGCPDSVVSGDQWCELLRWGQSQHQKRRETNWSNYLIHTNFYSTVLKLVIKLSSLSTSLSSWHFSKMISNCSGRKGVHCTNLSFWDLIHPLGDFNSDWVGWKNWLCFCLLILSSNVSQTHQHYNGCSELTKHNKI